LARQLIGLLSMFTPALSVPLAGDGTVTAARVADLARGKNDVDLTQNMLYNIRVLLYSPRMHDHAGFGATVQQTRCLDPVGGNAAYL